MKSRKHLTAVDLRHLAIRAERRATAALYSGRAAIDTPCPSCGREEDGHWFTPCPSEDCPSHWEERGIPHSDFPGPTEAEIQQAAEHVAAGIW